MILFEHGTFPISAIHVGDRIRLVDQAWAEMLAASIADTTLQNPIQLMKIGNEFHLMAGAHRIAAVKLLGRTEIEAKVYEPASPKPHLEVRLFEIDENLSRRELSALDRARNVAERREILDEIHGETRGGDQRGQRVPFSINEETANRLGLHTKTVKRALQLHRGLTTAARERLRGSRFEDNQAQLMAFVKASLHKVSAYGELTELNNEQVAKRQAAMLDLMLSEPPKAKSPHLAACMLDKINTSEKPEEKQLDKLMKAWLSARKPAQRQFLEFLREQGVKIGGADA